MKVLFNLQVKDRLVQVNTQCTYIMYIQEELIYQLVGIVCVATSAAKGYTVSK